MWVLGAMAPGGLLAQDAPTGGEEASPVEESAAPPASSPLSQLPIVRHTLENGLRVVLSPDRTIPTAGIAVYYDVGSRNEVQGRSGFAHLFEHMMFQGSANVGKGEHFALVMNRGGDMNGTTSADRTNYFETLPSNELALGLWLEADRMRSLAITAENFENQRTTVQEERRQSYENRPYMLSMLRINELAYGDYWPYAHSTIGVMQDLDNAPLEAVQEFFDQYYAPNNAVLSLAGDFDPDEAMQLVRRFFGDIASRPVPPYDPPDLSPQTAERAEQMLDPLAQLPAFHIGYHIPPDRSPDHYPLELLAIILGDGQSSRLYQKLVKTDEILTEIHVSTDGRRGPDLFSFWAVCASGHTGEEARRTIFGTLDDIARRGVTQRELEKAVNRVASSFIFGLQSNLSRARTLAEYEMYFGDAQLLRDELAPYQAITREDIQRVARQYFDATNRTVLDVIPAEAAGGAQ
jgi:predicted Zn-dependent peptidase